MQLNLNLSIVEFHNTRKMKKLFGIIAAVVFVGSLLASCAPHKQACAAYSGVDVEQVCE